MMAGSHVVVGMATVTALGAVAGIHPDALMWTGAAFGALLPDIDHPGSWIGRRVWVISVPISATFGHRGITHSLFAVAACIAWAAFHRLSGFWVPVALGYLSHLGTDALTPAGVPLLWPNRRVFSLDLFKTGSATEYVLSSLVVLGMAALVR